jgi:hypothetical protein
LTRFRLRQGVGGQAAHAPGHKVDCPYRANIVLITITVGVAHGYYGSGLRPDGPVHRFPSCFRLCQVRTTSTKAFALLIRGFGGQASVRLPLFLKEELQKRQVSKRRRSRRTPRRFAMSDGLYLTGQIVQRRGAKAHRRSMGIVIIRSMPAKPRAI